MATSSSNCHQFATPKAPTFKCSSDIYRLAITMHTCNPLLRGLNPFATLSLHTCRQYHYGNVPQLSFDFTTAYYFWTDVSISSRNLEKKKKKILRFLSLGYQLRQTAQRILKGCTCYYKAT
jgi:hypothetical protein